MRRCVLLLGIGALLALVPTVMLFPGYSSFDTLTQLKEAQSGLIGNWHPPIMTWMIGRLDHLLPFPGSLFLINEVLFWSGCFLMLKMLYTTKNALACSLLILLQSPITLGMALVGKDSSLCGVLCFATGMLLFAEKEESQPAFWVGMISLVWAICTRHNAIIAVFPIIVWGALIWRDQFLNSNWKPWFQRRISILSVSMAASLIALSITSALETRIIHIRQRFPFHQIMIFDLVGTSVGSRSYLLPRFMDRGRIPPIELRDLDNIYTRNGEAAARFAPRLSGLNGSEYRELQSCWWRAILSEPQAYLTHRAKVFYRFLLGQQVYSSPYCRFEALVEEPSPFAPQRRWIYRTFESVSHNLVFMPVTYLVLFFVFLIFGWVRGVSSKRAFYALTASGMSYLLAYFFILPALDFRYGLWSVCAASLIPFFINWDTQTGNPAKAACLPSLTES